MQAPASPKGRSVSAHTVVAAARQSGAPVGQPAGDSESSRQRRAGPMSVARVLAVIEHLAHGPLALADLGRELAAPKPSLLALLGELVQLGFIRKDQQGRYLLAGAAYRLAARVSMAGSMNVSMRATLMSVSTELEAAVSLGYLDPKSRTLVYADRYGENSAVRYVVKFGAAIELHTRATAKLLIAHQDESQWRAWFGPEPYKQLASRSHVGFAGLQEELRAIRRERIAWTCSEQYEGISGCAVPVLDAEEAVLAGIGLVMIGEAMNMKRERVVSSLQAAADTLSAEFKMRGITRANLAAYL